MSICEKKLINGVADCVSDSLRGLVALNPALRLLEGHNVVVRADLSHLIDAGKVTLLSGGGSGHEPGFAGFVGDGLLSGSVCGPVFTSPPPASILAAIRAVGQRNSAGTLLIVLNYTGDRLNFGLALEKARREGLRVAMVTVGEDCALTLNARNAGRRGLAGMILVQKIAGQMAEDGCSLAEITSACHHITSRMGTIGLTLAACCPPGCAPSFTLQQDEMELGLGIHGEAGVGRIKIQPAKEAVTTMLDHMTSQENEVRFLLEKGDCVALLVNNLGGLSVLELNIVVGEIIQLLESRGVVVERAYAGSFVTSLNMAGVSFSLLHLDDNSRRCLDAPTTAPGWVRPYLPRGATKRVTPGMTPCPADSSCHDDAAIIGLTVNTRTEATLVKALQFACTAVANCAKQLNAFDSQCGDGDSGDTLKRGADALLARLPSACPSLPSERPPLPSDRPPLPSARPPLPVACPHSLLLAISRVLELTMGGTSGALYSIFFAAAAAPLSEDVGAGGWCRALHAGTDAVMTYGGASRGDRTLVDALCAAYKAAEAALQRRDSSLEVFAAATEAAELAAIATTRMTARAGRASYVDPALLTQPDPGAHAIGILMRAAYEATRLGLN